MIVLAGGTITGVTLYMNGVFDAKKDTVAEQPAQTQAPSKKENKTEKSAIQTAKPTASRRYPTTDRHKAYHTILPGLLPDYPR